jgi:hypothetical protein
MLWIHVQFNFSKHGKDITHVVFRCQLEKRRGAAGIRKNAAC